MTTTVYVTRGGRRYHANETCRALASGQVLYGGWGDLRVHHIEATDWVTALGQSKDPCAICIPGLLTAIYRTNSENDYGHEPFEYDGVPICRRCFIQHRGWRETVAWPCTSAIVLGLIPREEATP
ncbi:hypothetical protein [Streptomyces sp. NPDC004008]